jgi:AcrR family transcriptional regulator
MSTAAATPARQRRKEARPAELLEAALALFGEKGFAATRTEEVAQRAGVSKGTLYLYYPSKEELFKAVIAHYLSARIADTAQRVEAYQGKMGPLLQDLLVGWWQQVYASPASATFKIIISESRNFPEIAEYYVHHADDIEGVVHSLVLPMVMTCAHKHGLGACSHHQLDGHAFIASHVALIVRGLTHRPRN